MGKLAVLPVIAALLLFATVTLVAARQPPFPLVGGTVEVEFANRIFALTQDPALLEFARMYRETVCINLTMPVENPAIFLDGSNYKISCLPWLRRFPGGSISWYRSSINEFNGERGTIEVINLSPGQGPPSVMVQGAFKDELNITSTLVTPAQEQTTSAIYTCEVCTGLNKGLPIEELRDDNRCFNSSVVTFNIGSPPIINDTFVRDDTFYSENDDAIRNFRVGSSPCLGNPPITVPPAQGEPSRDPATALRIRCDLLNAAATNEFPSARPPPLFRRWYFNGIPVYDVGVGLTPIVNQPFRDQFPSLDPVNSLVVYSNDGYIQINSNPGEAFTNRTDVSFGAVYGNWTCSLRNKLGTDFARFGTILRECGTPPVLPQKPQGGTVLVNSSGTVPIGCIGCVLTPPFNPTVSIDCRPASGQAPFRYQWSVEINDTAETILEDETSAMLSVSEEGIYICRVNNIDNPPQVMATTIIRVTPRLDFATTIKNRFGETLTDNGCSRLRGPSTTTHCTLIGDTIRLVCSSVNPSDRVFILTPRGEMVEGNGLAVVNRPINDTEDAGSYTCNFLDQLCGLFGPRITAGVYQPATIDRAIILPDPGYGAGRVIGEQIVPVGTVSLYCPFFGIDDPVTTWRIIEPDSRGFPVERVLDGSETDIGVMTTTIGETPTLVLTIDNFNGTATYVCRSKNIAGEDAGIVALSTYIDTVSAFQVQIGPVEHCVTWSSEKARAVESSIQNAILQVIELHCKCHFPPSIIAPGQFSCRTTTTRATYRSTIFGIVGYNASQLVDILQDWVDSGPTIKVDWLLLDVYASCQVHISSLSVPECSAPETQPFGDPTLITSDPSVIQCVHACLIRTQGRGICGV